MDVNRWVTTSLAMLKQAMSKLVQHIGWETITRRALGLIAKMMV